MGLMDRPAVGGLAQGIGKGLLGMQQIQQNQQQQRINEQNIRQNEIALKKQQAAEEMDNMLIPSTMLSDEAKGVTLPDGTPSPNYTKSQINGSLKKLFQAMPNSGYREMPDGTWVINLRAKNLADNILLKSAETKNAYYRQQNQERLNDDWETYRGLESKIAKLSQDPNGDKVQLNKLQEELKAKLQDINMGLQVMSGKADTTNEGWKPQTMDEALTVERAKKESSRSQNIQTYYKINDKGEVISAEQLDENDPASLQLIKSKGLVPANDPRIIQNRQQGNINLTLSGLQQTPYQEAGTGTPLLVDKLGNIKLANVPKGVETQIKPTEGMVKQQAEIENMSQALDRIKASYDPNYIGLYDYAKGVGKEYTVYADDTQVQFYADVNSIKDSLLRAKSGAQINEQEYARLTKLVPDPKLSETAFLARIKRFEKELKSVMEGRTKARQGKSGQVLTPEQEADDFLNGR